MQTLTCPRLTMLPRSCVERSNCWSVMARIPPRLRNIKPIRLELTTPGRSRGREGSHDEPIAVEEAARLEVTSVVRTSSLDEAQRAGEAANVIEGTAEPVALPAPHREIS